MKGIELPINILVIVAVAVIVLLGVVALFFSGWFSGVQPMSLEAAKTQACNVATRGTCTQDPAAISVNYDVNTDNDATNDNLQGLCTSYYGTGTDQRACLSVACGMDCGND